MFKFSEVLPGIFHLEFDDKIELVASFLRVQEYYESPKFQGKPFQLMDYIKWYIRENPGEYGTPVFTYFKDWGGFNVPAEVVLDCHHKITDAGDHDHFIYQMAKKAISKSPSGRAYLIGTSLEQPTAIAHEIAHGLFYMNSDYKQAMLEALVNIPSTIMIPIEAALRELGYAEFVILDEVQAFLATGLCRAIEDNLKASKVSSRKIALARKACIAVYEAYSS